MPQVCVWMQLLYVPVHFSQHYVNFLLLNIQYNAMKDDVFNRIKRTLHVRFMYNAGFKTRDVLTDTEAFVKTVSWTSKLVMV